MTQNEKIERFWGWFSSIAASLEVDPENHSLLDELDARMSELDPLMSWEIGPGAHEAWQLVISPNLDRNLRTQTQEIISHAPVIQGWEFHSTRRPKDWDYKLLMERPNGQDPIYLDASEWEFVLLRYPGGDLEILLQGKNLPYLTDDERWQAAAITLESILGEDVVLDQLDEFELVGRVESRFTDKLKPIQRLREVVLGLN
jgi:hypothetical protein